MDPNIRNFKDFLQLYNQMTERCFARCVEQFNSREVTQYENECIDRCALKFIKFNNKLMMNFVRSQNEIVLKRNKETEALIQKEEAKTESQQRQVQMASS